MSSDLSARIDAMFRRDRPWAGALAVGLWCAVGFVLVMICPLANDSTARGVMIAAAQRGLMTALLMLPLGWVAWRLTTPDHSLPGRYAGGIFAYAISVLGACKRAPARWEVRHRRAPAVDGGLPTGSGGGG